MKMTKEQTILGLEDLQTAVVSACASRNRHARVAGFSPIQLVFGKDRSIPTNLMDAMAGQFSFNWQDQTVRRSLFIVLHK